jgi:hypothetical protein
MTREQLSAKIGTTWMHNEAETVYYLLDALGSDHLGRHCVTTELAIPGIHPTWRIPIDDFLRDYYEVHEVTRWERVGDK